MYVFIFIFFVTLPRPPLSTLFPYTTLFPSPPILSASPPPRLTASQPLRLSASPPPSLPAPQPPSPSVPAPQLTQAQRDTNRTLGHFLSGARIIPAGCSCWLAILLCLNLGPSPGSCHETQSARPPSPVQAACPINSFIFSRLNPTLNTQYLPPSVSESQQGVLGVEGCHTQQVRLLEGMFPCGLI